MVVHRHIRGYGWKRSFPDRRDHHYAPRLDMPLPPILNLALQPFVPASYDQLRLGSCFPPGTRVRLAAGDSKLIEDIRLLDRVVTAEGRVGIVTSLSVRPVTDGLRRLVLWGHNLLRCTPEHPVLTQRGYIPAGNLNNTDYVALPIYAANERTRLRTADYLPAQAKVGKGSAASERMYGGVAGRTTVAVKVCPLPESIDLTPEFGRIVGLFLAEGSADSGKVQWTFGPHEKDTLAIELMNLLRTKLNVEPRLQVRGNKTVNVILYGTAWVHFWKGICATGSGSKRLCSDAMAGPSNFLLEVYRGWMDGDGHLEPDGRKRGVTISRELALQMVDILNLTENPPAIRESKPSLNKHAVTRRTRYDIEEGGQGMNYRCHKDKTHLWRRVRQIEVEPYVGPVYNMTVTGDNSYVADGIGVHNCVPNEACWAFRYAVLKEGRPDFEPSRLFAYYQARLIEGDVESDGGAYIRDCVKSLASVGVPPEADWPYDISQFATAPSAAANADAPKHRIASYLSVTLEPQIIKASLVAGYPVVLGMAVFPQMESAACAENGIVQMPALDDAPIGEHCVRVMGYDDTSLSYLMGNSWGSDWGLAPDPARPQQRGYFQIPQAYIHNPGLCSDAWTIRVIAPDPAEVMRPDQ